MFNSEYGSTQVKSLLGIGHGLGFSWLPSHKQRYVSLSPSVFLNVVLFQSRVTAEGMREIEMGSDWSRVGPQSSRTVSFWEEDL